MATIAMRVAIHCPACAPGDRAICPRCGSTRAIDEMYGAWLAIPRA